MNRLLIKVQAEHDQDLMEADRWWRKTSEEVKLQILELIAGEYEDPLMELMSRFAQLGFTMMALRNEQ